MSQVDLKEMSIEQIKAHRARLDDEIKKRVAQNREEATRQILTLASEHDIDLGKLAREVRVYRNPDDPWDTWPGRGRRPRWVQKWLASGRSLDELETRNEDGTGTADA